MPMLSERIGAMTALLRERLRDAVDRQALVGALAAVVDRDGLVATEAAGFADVDSRRPMRADDLFWIASQTKPVTATALMMLVDDGRVRLDDPVSDYVPAFGEMWLQAEADDDHILLRRPARPVTLRDLLSHTSGLPFLSAAELPAIDRVPLSVLVDSYRMTPLLTEPGTKYSYSNMGTNTVGRVIEVIDGRPFETFLQDRLFDPLGMTDTTFRPTDEQITRLPTAYGPSSDKARYERTSFAYLTYPLSDPTRYPAPGGGLFSTVADVAKFCRMILRRGELDGRRYLSEQAVAEMTARQTPLTDPTAYGLQWALNGPRFGHGGAGGTNMVLDPNAGVAVLFMTQITESINAGNTVETQLTDGLFELLNQS